MSIEFRCDQCQNLLRTGDESLGKKARCPQCGNIQTVTTATSVTAPAASTLSFAGRGSPESTPSERQNPFARDPSPNPYEAFPTAAIQPANSTSMRAKTMGPAIALIVVSILGCLMTALVLLGGVINVTTEGMQDDDAIMLVIFSLSFVLLLIALVGSIQMLRHRSYKLAMTAAVLSLLPTSCIWCVGLPFGIWALIVLLDPDTRQAFQ